MKQIRIWPWGNSERQCRVWEEGRTWSFRTTDTVREILARYPEHEVIEAVTKLSPSIKWAGE